MKIYKRYRGDPFTRCKNPTLLSHMRSNVSCISFTCNNLTAICPTATGIGDACTIVLLPCETDDCSVFQEARCGFAIILMALFWCTECMPLAITALLPVVLFPMMGIMESGKVQLISASTL